MAIVEKYFFTNVNDPTTQLTNTQVIVLSILYLTILVLAIMRALKCSQPNADSRAIHFLFSFISPSLYLITSFLVPDFCKN